MISAAEFREIHGNDNVIPIGVIDPLQGLIPFSNASNPVHGSMLVWTPDYSAGGNPEALSTAIPTFRRTLQDMENLISKSGGTADSLYVVYSSDSLAQGARVAWQLRMLGLNVRFLDGGVAAWRSANGRTGSSRRLNDERVKNEVKAPSYDTAAYDATIEVVIEAAQNPHEWVIIDVRNNGGYNGTERMSNAYGTGRIKGAVHVEWTRAHDSNSLMHPEAELRDLYGFIGDRKVIVYCQGGVRSAYTWIVLKDLGFDVLNYNGSWAEWSFAASEFGDYHNRDLVVSLTEEWSDNRGSI